MGRGTSAKNSDMTGILEEFRQYLPVDKFGLDDELCQQSELLFKVSEAYEEALAKRDELKERLATIDAELDGEIREELEKNDEKATDPKVKALVQADIKHQKAFTAYAQAKLLAGKLSALKDSFKDRGFMIRALGDLYVANYFEQKSVQGTSNTDTVVYHQRRARLADHRERRKEEKAHGKGE